MTLSQSLSDKITLIGFVNDLKEFVPVETLASKVYFLVFGENKGCINLVRAPKMKPRTKHTALKYHHFESHLVVIQYRSHI